MTEPRDTRLRRLTMRSMRRGIKEMDIVLSRYAAARLVALGADDLDTYEVLLEENDHDLYQWVSRQTAPPARFAGVIDDIMTHAVDTQMQK